jgi:U3 small nucleolar RNA-associated protein 14
MSFHLNKNARTSQDANRKMAFITEKQNWKKHKFEGVWLLNPINPSENYQRRIIINRANSRASAKNFSLVKSRIDGGIGLNDP